MATEYRLSYTANEIDEKLGKIDTLAEKGELPTKVSDLTNDAGYLTEHQSLAGLATQSWVNTQLATFPTPDVSGQIGTHNSATDSHNDIRLLVEGLTTRLNALANSDDTTLDQMSEVVAYIKNNKTLIDGITTNKVNVSDIINNLTTNVSNKPLSAAQGVALKALIDAIVVPTKVSQLTNDSGFITGYTETDPTVPSWAKATSKPSYTKSEVGLGNVDNVKQYSASNPPPYPVTSVNGKTGAVSLAASDVGADASGTATSTMSTHNTSTTAHADIRESISVLSADVNDIKWEIPIRGTHYWTPADQESIVQQVVAALGTPVFGTVDTNKVIDLTGELVDGTYTFRYIDENGDTHLIGTYTKASAPNYTNRLPKAIGYDGEVLNGTGYLDNYRMSSNQTTANNYCYVKALDGYFVTGFMPYTTEQAKNLIPLYIKGVDLDTPDDQCKLMMFNSPTQTVYAESCLMSNTALNGVAITKLGDLYYKITPKENFRTTGDWAKYNSGEGSKYIRLCAKGSGAGVIITINEPIE